MAKINKWASARGDILQVVGLLLAVYIGYLLVIRPDDIAGLKARIGRLEAWRACVLTEQHAAAAAGKTPHDERCANAGG